jgi:NADH dehydrogenase FAD-containing subunit
MAIVGGGATAIELAFELVAAYPDIEVTMVSPSVGEGLSEGARRAIEDRLEEAGVERDARRVEAVTADGLSFEDGAMDFDIVVWAAGFTASSLGKDAGLAVGTQDRILVDAQLRSVSHPDVYVAGDAALPPAECGAPALMSCRLAIPMALRASENLAAGLVGAESKPLRIRDTLRCLSLGRDDGLIQLMRSDGRPRSLFITGRPAAFVKEMVVRSTISAIRHYRARARRARRRSQPTADLALPRTRPGLE